jgi:hypothetical protein
MTGKTTSDTLADVLTDLEEAYGLAEITPDNRVAHFEELHFLRTMATRLRDLTDDIDSRIAETFEKREKVSLGGDVYEAKRTARRRNWQDADLIRAVLDSVIIDRETGEIMSETPAEKLAAVFPPRGYGARLTELRRRGIADDEFCDVEWSRVRLAKVYR